jgi:glycosyltransferase involved in cell wall biosynthesis
MNVRKEKAPTQQRRLDGEPPRKDSDIFTVQRTVVPPSRQEATVGIRGIKYAILRNILYNSINGVRHVWTKDICGYCRSLQVRCRSVLRNQFPLPAAVLDNLWLDLGSKYDLLHFFNIVSIGRTPWITTTESVLPRGGSNWPIFLRRRAERALNSQECRKVIAISQNAYDKVMHSMSDAAPKVMRSVNRKLLVLHPPQKPFMRTWDRRDTDGNDRIVFSFVGRDFFQKGGMEVLEVFDKLIDEGLPVNLRVVSSMGTDNWVTNTDSADVEKARAIIRSHPKSIEHRHRISQPSVIELFKESDVALLPSYQETYGYVVLEAQAAGCAVVTTDQGAFPEINNSKCGWLIRVPMDNKHLGCATFRTAEGRRKISGAIRSGIERVVRQVVQNPALIAKKGRRALRRVHRDHDPVRHAKKLSDVYQKALGA